MTDDLSRIPAEHHPELAHLVQIVRHAFRGPAISTFGAAMNTSRVLRVDLFSQTGAPEASLDDLHRPTQLLVVTDQGEQEDFHDGLTNAETRIRNAMMRHDRIWRPALITVHARGDFERQLATGSSLLAYILRRGINLHAEVEAPSGPTRTIDADEALSEACAQNDACRLIAADFLARAAEGGRLSQRKAVFLMHQAAEHAYARALRVLALYAPRTHDLRTLRALAEPIAPQLSTIWPGTDAFQRRAFEILQASYGHRRAARPWYVTDAEVAWLAARTTKLVNTVELVCDESLVALRSLTRKRHRREA